MWVITCYEISKGPVSCSWLLAFYVDWDFSLLVDQIRVQQTKAIASFSWQLVNN